MNEGNWVLRCRVCGTNNDLGTESKDCLGCGEPLSAAERVERREDAGCVVCATPHCSGRWPAGTAVCGYCDKPLGTNNESGKVSIEWPWGESTLLDHELIIGREPPAPDWLISKLEPQFDYVSRLHARIVRSGASVYVEDLGSRHGTWVNDTRVDRNGRAEFRVGDRLRFAKDLVVTIRASGD